MCFLSLFATTGIRVSFGSYITSWEKEFGISRTLVATISMISFCTLAIAQPLIGRLNDRFGARTVLTASMLLTGSSLLLCAVVHQLWQLAILYGLVLSFGLTGGSNITSAATLTRWFSANRGLAFGLSLSGMAVGQLTVVPLSLYLISAYGWRFTMGAVGCAVLALFTPLMFLLVRSRPQDLGLRPYGEIAVDAGPAHHLAGQAEDSMFAVLKQGIFWRLAIPYFICGFTDVGLVDTHYIPFAQGKGIPLAVIAFTFSLMALFNIVGTISTGHMADRWHLSRLIAAVYVFRAATFVLPLLSDRPWMLAIFAATYGATEMATIAPMSSICSHLFRRNSIGVVFGLVSVSHQLGGALGSLVPGIFYDRAGTYTPVFVMSIVLLLASAVVVYRIPDSRQAQ